MLGWQIFVHSVRMVFGNLKQAFQISLVPALVGLMVVIALGVVFGISFEDISTEPNGLPDAATPASIFGFLLSVFACILAIMIWIVVSWHRFVLLEEYPSGFLPDFKTDRVLAYLGRLLMLIVLGLVIMIPAIFVIALLSSAAAIVGILAWLALVVGLTILFYRVSPILPDAAVGGTLRLSEAWRATAGSEGAIIVLVIVSFLFQILIQVVTSLLLFIPIIGFLIVILASMLIVPLVNVSILTTLYGVFIEKRQLS